MRVGGYATIMYIRVYAACECADVLLFGGRLLLGVGWEQRSTLFLFQSNIVCDTAFLNPDRLNGTDNRRRRR